MHRCRLIAAFSIWLFLPIVGQAQRFQPVRHLGEIGHLHTEHDKRIAADFGFVKVMPGETGERNFMGRDHSRFEGRDDGGTRWRALIATQGGVGWTDLWAADFDANGREDLMIAAHTPGNGRCIDRIDLTFLLFDEEGRPVPWSMESYLPLYGGPGKMPAILRDVNGDGRAEFVATSCGYADRPRWGESRGIDGVYEAKDARWQLVRPTDLTPYTSALKANHAQPDFVYFTRERTESWEDHGNAATLLKAPQRILKTLPADRRIDHERFLLADGTVCHEFPTVVFDFAGGREIVDQHVEEVSGAWKRISREGLSVMPMGSGGGGSCRPTLLWVTKSQ